MNSATQRLISAALAVTVLLLAVMPALVSAELATPPLPPALPARSTSTDTTTPTATPIPSAGSSTGGNSGGSSTAQFQSYKVDLKATDGTILGNITATGPSSAKLWAERVVQIDGLNYTVLLTADLDSVPTAPALDILAATGEDSELIASNYDRIAAFNITRYSKGEAWKLKAGTASLYITAPAEALYGTDLNSSCYLLKNDTASNILYQAIPDTLNESAATFVASLDYEHASPASTGTYSLIGKKLPSAGKVSVTSTHDPNPTASAATATAAEGTSPFLVSGLLALGLVIGLVTAVAFMGMINRK